MSLLSGCHVSHLENVDTDELDRLLRLVVDVENLFMCVHKEEDSDTKQVYFFLFKVNIQHGHIHSVVDSWFMLSITCSLVPPPPPFYWFHFQCMTLQFGLYILLLLLYFQQIMSHLNRL